MPSGSLLLYQKHTHTQGALYEAFEPSEARRILRKLEFQVVSLNTVGRIIDQNSEGESHEQFGPGREFLPE
jgi:hypothetical protein